MENIEIRIMASRIRMRERFRAPVRYRGFYITGLNTGLMKADYAGACWVMNVRVRGILS